MGKAAEKVSLRVIGGQYAKTVGYYIPTTGRRAGQRTERVWLLGRNRADAEAEVMARQAVWHRITRSGRNVWTAADEAACQVIVRGPQLDDVWTLLQAHNNDLWETTLKNIRDTYTAAGLQMPPLLEFTDSPQPTTTMLWGTLADYSESVKTAALSTPYKQRVIESVEAIKHYAADGEAVTTLTGVDLDKYLADPKGSTAFQKDIPLTEVNRVWLERLTNHAKSRPLSRKRDRLGERQPIKPNTVKTLLQHWSQAFDWIDSNLETYGWEAPRKVDRLFDLELSRIQTKEERDQAADGPVQITVDQMTKLYAAIKSDTHRIWFLMGLFSAQGQTELAVTRRNEIDLPGRAFIHRRNKTGQPGQYWLPEELCMLIERHWTKNDDLAFRTSKGYPLVTENSDAVRQAFEDWRKEAEVTGPTFYSLRRYFGDKAQAMGGEELKNAALSHRAYNVGVRYSGRRDYGRVGDVGKAIYAELKATGMFTAEQPKSGVA